jgi:hypothetical protein
MKKLLFATALLILGATFLRAQGVSIPVPLRAVVVNGITNSSTVIDNRSTATRHSTLHMFCATGTGGWTAIVQYSDASAQGPWTHFSDATATVTSSSPTCAGYGTGYHAYISFSVTGTVSISYSGTQNIYLAGGGSGTGGGTVTNFVTPTVPSWLTATVLTPTTTPNLTLTPTTGQTAGQVIGTCGSATTFGPCALTVSDIPALPYQPTGNYITSITGDATASGPGAAALTLATVNSNVGSCGDATHSSQITLNAKGLATGCTPITINAIVNPMTSSGDMIYGGTAGAPTRLPAGTAGQILTIAGGIPTWAAATGATALSAIVPATGANTIANGDNAQIWQWLLTTSGKSAFTFGEPSASSAGGTPYLVNVQTASGSTVNPFVATAGGTANGVQVLKSGFLSSKGTGGIDSNMLRCDVTTSTKCIQDVLSGITAANTRAITWQDVSGIVAYTNAGGPVLPGFGGTGAGAFTTGSIPYIGASGVYQQDNANLFYDAVNKCAGIGTNSCSPYNLSVKGQSGAGASMLVASVGVQPSSLSFSVNASIGLQVGEQSNGDLRLFNTVRGSSFIYVPASTGQLELQPTAGDITVGGAIATTNRLDIQSCDSGGCLQVFNQGSGDTLTTLRASATQTGNILTIASNGGTAQAGIDASYHFNAPQFTSNAANGASLNANLNLSSVGAVNWTDVCTDRSSPGLMEIDNCTPGAYRDLILRNLTINALASSPGCLQVGSGQVTSTGIPCGSGSGGTAYTTSVTNVSSYTIPAATHGQGTTPIVWLFDSNATTFTVTGATNASPIVITVVSTTGLSSSSVVGLSGVLGNTAANGIWQIAGLTGTTFQLVGSTGSGAWTSGGTVAIGAEANAPNYYRDAAGDVLLTFVPNFTGTIQVGGGAGGGGSGGTITSISMTAPSALFVSPVGGSPITSGAGTLALTLANQPANCVVAGPASGGATTPTCRSLVLADEVAAGAVTQVQFSNGTTFASSPYVRIAVATGQFSLGLNGTATGQMLLQNGNTSGASVFVQNSAATTAWNFNMPASPGVAGQPLLSGGGGSTAQTYGTVGVPAGGTGNTSNTAHGVMIGEGSASLVTLPAAGLGTILTGQGATTDPSFSASPTLGIPGTTAGSLTLAGPTSGLVTLKTASAAGTWSMTLPTGTGTAGQFLQTDGTGTTSWTTALTSLTFSAPLTGGTVLTTGTAGCPTCVVATTPGAGIAHFAGSTQTVTSSLVSLTADVTGILGSANGGDGVNNGTFTETRSGNVTFTGAFNPTFAIPSSSTWAFPSGSDTLVTLTATQTLTNKTLTTPTIASFVNATHNHTNAAGGGPLSLTSAAFANTGTTVTVLHGNAAGNLTFGAVSLTTDVTGVLPPANLPVATTIAKGVVQTDGSTITNSSGAISCTTATVSQIGCVRPDGSTITITGGVISATTSGGITGLTTNVIPKATSATTIGNSSITDNGTTVSTTEAFAALSVSSGSAPPTVTWGTGGGWAPKLGTAPTSGCVAAGQICVYGDSTSNTLLASYNGGSLYHLGQVVASGTLVMGTSAISSGACATAVTATATGVATTDTVSVSFNGDPTGVTGYIPSTSGTLTIFVYPGTNLVSAKACNQTGTSITPGALTLNFGVVR